MSLITPSHNILVVSFAGKKTRKVSFSFSCSPMSFVIDFRLFYRVAGQEHGDADYENNIQQQEPEQLERCPGLRAEIKKRQIN